MIKIILYFLAIFSLLACASKKELIRNVDEYYASSGVEQYFLSEIPSWINFSTESACHRDETLRYFNLEKLMKSFSLSYADAIQVQASFNDEFLELKSKLKAALPIREEEILFYRATEKTSNKILFFEAPAFKRIHLIWLDEALASPEAFERLKVFLNSSISDEGQPVFVTNCLSLGQAQERFSDLGMKFITTEMFSIYDIHGNNKPKFMLDVSAFFNEDQELLFYMQNKSKIINQLEGNFKVQNY